MSALADNTLAGLVQMNDRNLADIDVTDLLQDAPLLQVLVAVAASQGGTVHKYTKETVAAGAEFRDVNTGILNAAPQEELITATCKYLDASFKRDVAIADGFRNGRGAYMEKEARKALKAAMAGLEKQYLQGVSADADGFVGFPGSSFVDGLDDGMVVNAGGAGGRSVWLIRTTKDDLAAVAGNDGEMSLDYDPDQMPQFLVTNVDGTGYNVLNAALGGWYTLQFGSRYSLGRIVNLDSTEGNTLTDDMIAEAISKFPASRQPTHIVMDRVMTKELRESRTATNPTGQPAPFPEEAFNLPIVISDHVGTGESTIVTTTAVPATTT